MPLAVAIVGVLHLKVNPDASKSLLPTTGQAAADYDWYLANYPADYGSLLAATGDLCSAEALAVLENLRLDVEALPEVYMAVGLASAEYVATKMQKLQKQV